MAYTARKQHYRVGELRPSQTLFTYGVGSIVDLPNISALVMGLEDWDTAYASEIGEARLLQAVRSVLGSQVNKLLTPPAMSEQIDGVYTPFDEGMQIGVPVASFPRWMLCPRCRRLAPLDSGLFQLKVDQYRPDRMRYVHVNCSRANAPAALPARFLVACAHGHLDDFPWVYFVHHGETQCSARLTLREIGVSGEAAEIEVECEVCDSKRRMSDAFSSEGPRNLPPCNGRRPHLRDYDTEVCEEQARTISLGASNSWFPVILSTLAVPTASNKLNQLVEEYWHVLEKTTSQQNIELLRQIGQLPRFATYSDTEIWRRVESHKSGEEEDSQPVGLKVPEWQVLSKPDIIPPTHDFRANPVPVSAGYEQFIEQVVLVERLRVVQALVGFTRIESPGDATDGYSSVAELLGERRTPLSRRKPVWTPAGEVRGEGIFLQFREDAIQSWLNDSARRRHNHHFFEAHKAWRMAHRIPFPEQGYPGLRYVLLHSFAHALIRRLTLECGYTASSIRERIYSLEPGEDGPMAGILLYTSAHDSEGTLGGLVSLGQPDQLARHLDGALIEMQYCTSDPLCAEHTGLHEHTLHEAACHACLFLPETACERGNKYLDRSVLVPTVDREELAFFGGSLLK